MLGLVYVLREPELAGHSTIRLAVMATVLLSIYAHGLIAQPGINVYARRIAALDETSPRTPGATAAGAAARERAARGQANVDGQIGAASHVTECHTAAARRKLRAIPLGRYRNLHAHLRKDVAPQRNSRMCSRDGGPITHVYHRGG